MDKQSASDSDRELFGLTELATQVVESDERGKFINEHFHLPWNPFPEPGVPSPEVMSTAPIRATEAKKIGQFISDAYRKPFSTKILVIKGQYGSGKSLMLKRIVSLVNDLFSGKGEQSAIAVYVGRPSFEAQELNRAILENLGMDNIRKMVWIVIKKQFAEDIANPADELKRLWSELLNPTKKTFSSPQSTFFGDTTIPQQLFSPVFNADSIDDYRTFLSKYDKQGWNRTRLRKYFAGLLTRGMKPVSTAGVLEAYVDLLLAFDDKEAWDSLVGMQTKKSGAKVGFALRFLEDLLDILSVNGYAYLFLVIDEFEQITEERLLTARERADYGYTMMEVINKVNKGLGIIIGITPEGFDRLSEIAPLSDRLVSSIELRPLKTNEIKILIEYYLDEARNESKEYRRYKSKLFPFSDEVADLVAKEITSIALGATPRNVLQFAYHLLEYCVDHNHSTLTPQVIKEFMPIYRQMKAREIPNKHRGR